MIRWPGAGIGLLLLAVTTLGAPATSPKRVLVLDPVGRDVAPFGAAVSAFRASMARVLGEPVDIYKAPLGLARFVVDAARVPCEKNEALPRLYQAANTPLFGYYANEFGWGMIGGRLYQDSEIGARCDRTALLSAFAEPITG